MRQLRIVYVWDADYPWDVRTEKIARSLTEAGHDVHIVCRNKAWNAPLEHRAEGTVHRMAPWRAAGRRVDTALGFPAFFNPRWKALLANTVRQTRADLIIVRDLPLCPTGIAVGRRARVPVILDMAEHYPAIMQEIFTSRRHKPADWIVRNPRAVKAVERYCLRRVQHVFTVVGESADRLISEGVPAEKISVIGNTPPKARALASGAAEKPARRARGTIDMVYLGLLEVSRGINELIEACGMLAAERPPVRAILIGSGRDESVFRQHARELGLDESGKGLVVFEGFLANDAAIARVAMADIGVLPLHLNDHINTTVPNKLFDYMSVGLPVITTDAVPSARIVRETGCGEVYREKDVGDLVAAIRRLLDPDVRLTKGAAGRAAIIDRYNWESDSGVLLRTVEAVATTAVIPA